jgi:Uma2 family endonuclease
MAQAPSSPERALLALRYVRAPRPIVFPSEAEVPEGKRHLQLRTFLFQLLQFAFARECSIGSDQFVYWNASDPKRCLAPDAFVRLGVPDGLFDVWKTWEHGTPELAVEILSRSDGPDEPWNDKLARYHELGVRELVRFDPQAPAGSRIRVWDRVEDDLVEREVEHDTTPCVPLKLFWIVAPIDGFAVALRLARDPDKTEILLSELETARAVAATARAESQAARGEAKAARREAETARSGKR